MLPSFMTIVDINTLHFIDSVCVCVFLEREPADEDFFFL